jgi:acid phosphatase
VNGGVSCAYLRDGTARTPAEVPAIPASWTALPFGGPQSCRGSWHVAQAVRPDADSVVSKNSLRPSAVRVAALGWSPGSRVAAAGRQDDNTLAARPTATPHPIHATGFNRARRALRCGVGRPTFSRMHALKRSSALFAIASLFALDGCGRMRTSPPSATLQTVRDSVKTIVVIYAENRSFDNLFGKFPGANGLRTVLGSDGRPTSAYMPQKDRDGVSVLPTLPPTWRGVTHTGVQPVVTQAQSAGLPNAPFAIETGFERSAKVTLSTSTITRDLWHRFFENQMQIAGGRNDGFAAWSDAGGLTMGGFDYSSSAMFRLAREFVLADNFFQGAFGGSFLNHQYLICACAPVYPGADTAPAKPTIAELRRDASGNYLPVLATATNSPASALDGPPVFANSGNLTPANFFGDGQFYAVNTMQPAYQPSGNAPSRTAGSSLLLADPLRPTTLPPQTEPTIGDRLSARNVSWAWYGGSWNAAVADGPRDAASREVIYRSSRTGIATPDSVDFQAHHQPFNYYAAFDPAAHPAYRAGHLKDYEDLVAAAANGTLPSVAFYKPEGLYNQHPGNTNLMNGDARIADLVGKLQSSPQWKQMVIVVTYDEFGGAWDHVGPPKGDRLGPGTRIPAIIISPFAKKGTVDHTQYDTGSVIRLISTVFGLDPLRGITRRDSALVAAGGRAMGDLTNALHFR